MNTRRNGEREKMVVIFFFLGLFCWIHITVYMCLWLYMMHTLFSMLNAQHCTCTIFLGAPGVEFNYVGAL